MKVKLVRPLIAEIAQLDSVATAAIDPEGPASSGYDPDFKETVLAAREPDAMVVDQRQEKTLVQIPAQVEVGTFEQLKQSFSGALPNTQMVLVMDFEDLHRLELMDPESDETLLRSSDRITRILNGRGEVIETFLNPPGMFIIELRPSYGLNNDRNILLAFCSEREQGIAKAF